MRFFTSDHHIDHSNILKYDNRPFTDLFHMRTELINRHNSVVNDGDDVYILGDFSFNFNAVESVCPRLNGNLFLIPGNHDKAWKLSEQLRNRYKEFGVTVLERSCNLTLKDGRNVVLSHFPYVNHDPRYQDKLPKDDGLVLLHGHTHCKPENILFRSTKGTLCIDVGVRGHNYYPWSEDELIEVINENCNI